MDMFDANFDDLNVGDKIVIIHPDDKDLEDWYEKQKSQILTIDSFSLNEELLWVEENCPYAIQMACVLKV